MQARQAAVGRALVLASVLMQRFLSERFLTLP
jgi:hypothetical protein